MFVYPQKVLFKHCDPAGIVFYPRYFEMINDCIEAFFEELNSPLFEILKKNGVPTAKIETQFQAPSRHGDQLELSLEPTHIGGSSLHVEIQAKAGPEARFTSNSVLVYVDAFGKSESWPASLRQSLTSHLRSTS